MWNKRIYGIKLGEITAVISLYLILSFIYRFTLWTSYWEKPNKWEKLFNLWEWFDSAGLQYMMMLIATAIIWILIFRVCKEWPLNYRLLLHVVTLPFFIMMAWKGYYWVCEGFDMKHLEGNAEKWDIYIPALIYMIEFSIFHAYEYYVSNQKKLRNEIELKNAALKSELSAIKAQLNPHFLYNVFNTINAGIPKEMEGTREMIADLSDLFRYQLKASKEDLVSLKDELDFVRKYLDLEQKRFEDRLQIDIDVEESLLSRQIPPMLLQPLVENSIKHGISPLTEGGSVTITIKEENKGTLLFEIKDTGVGVKDKAMMMETGVGLSNTQKRLEKIYNSGLFLFDNHPRGLVVQFSI
ncbi:histidine kinase [Aquimarina sp. MMG016]|uniref:sensor histidine kinase n=1 Tax=Aquimarina sp. MMG016 TaxID=2822690 RepID=UPI001B3A505C|nr:histidine kinase [Aquimarina sp. MMG016]MBQ4822596.1 histidine kinase [Aquimarina sp. MMG016]